MTALQAFRIVAPEFAAMNDADVTAILDFVSNELSESKFGSDYAKAHAYLAAHFLAWQKIVAIGSTTGAATGGRVISEKEGELARSYADGGSNQAGGTFLDNFDRTAYGLEYKRLARKHIVPILTRMG
jgi:hypothetical protein